MPAWGVPGRDGDAPWSGPWPAEGCNLSRTTGRSPAPQDDEAWRHARTQDTASALDAYVEAFSWGRHLVKARARSAELKPVVDPATDRFQRYAHTFRGVLGDIEFDLIGGDAVVEGLRVEVVDSPTLVEMTLECKYPEYMERPERTLPAASLMQIPQGTLVTVRAAANKRLVGVRIDSAGHEQYLEDALLRELAELAQRQEELRGQTVTGGDLGAVAEQQGKLADAPEP